MAKVFLVYGTRGAGKTTATLTVADGLAHRGIAVGGYFQQSTTDDLERRGYDLVRVGDRTQTVPLARPGGTEQAGTSAVCTFSFSQESFAAGLGWLQQDAPACRVLVLDEISKLEVRGEGHAQALRWALGLGEETLLLLSVRGDQLFYVMEAFALEAHVAGYLELPAEPSQLREQIDQLACGLLVPARP